MSELKEIIKKIIILNQEYIKNLKVFKRDYKIEKNGNYIITGLRRAGKTWFLYHIAKEHVKSIENVLYINFEDERLIGLTHKDFDIILEGYKELYQRKPIIFLDEIQNIPHWEKFARRLADSGYRIYITGSNAKMLSSELASTLGGRFFIKEISPLSFKEYINIKNFELKPNFEYSDSVYEIKRLFNEYLIYGGFPELINFKDKREYLSGVYQKLFYGDIIARHKISNSDALRLLIKKLAESVNNETSINRIKNIIKSASINIGNNTLFDYLGFLKDSFMINEIKNYTSKIVDRERKKKYYFADNGLLSLFLLDQHTKLLENLVHNELKRKISSDSDIFYFKRNLEVDFYVPDKRLMIQVSYNLSDENTLTREIKGLLSAMSEEKREKGYILTYDSKKTIKTDGKTIEILPVWQWILK